MRNVIKLIILSICLSLGLGCASDWTYYRVVTGDSDNYQTFSSGSPEWCKKELGDKRYRVYLNDWHANVITSGKKDGKWIPEMGALSDALSRMDGMWNGYSGAYPVSTTTHGDISWTRYVDLPRAVGVSLRRKIIVEVGNEAWVKSLTPAWSSNEVSRCFPYEFRIEIRSNTRNKYGWWIPDEGCDALGREFMKFPGVL